MKIKIVLILATALSIYSVYGEEAKICKSKGFPEIGNSSINDIVKVGSEVSKLTPKQIKDIHYQLCRDVYTDSIDFNTEHFRSIIAKGIGIDHKVSGSNKLISDFLNDNHDDLICPKDPTDTTHRKKHIFKEMILRGYFEIFDDIVMDDDEYEIDFNAYEIVDGKKETLIDYIDLIIKKEGDPDGDYEFLIEDIQDLGGKRGADL